MTKQNNNVPETNLVAQDQAVDMEFLKSFGGGALDNLSQHDIIMPRYKLVQNTSKTGTPGKWVSNLSPDVEFDSLSMVIFSITNFRVMFPEAGQGDKPLCRSNNGKTKADASGMGDCRCDNCRYAVWDKDPRTSKPVPPKCRSGYTLMGMIILPDGSSEPAMISIKGTAIKPAKQFFTRMKSKGIPPFSYITTIGSASTVNDKGRFFVPLFDFGPYLNKEAVIDVAEQVREYAKFAESDMMIDYEGEEAAGYQQGGGAPSSGAQEFLNNLNEGFQPVEDNDIPF